MNIVSIPKILCNIVWTRKKISQRGDCTGNVDDYDGYVNVHDGNGDVDDNDDDVHDGGIQVTIVLICMMLLKI